MVLHSGASTNRKRGLRLERIHAEARLERRSLKNLRTPKGGGGHGRQIGYSDIIPIYRRRRRTAPLTGKLQVPISKFQTNLELAHPKPFLKRVLSSWLRLEISLDAGY